jgi:hypothetical protein
MKKLLVILSVLAFFLIAVPVQADWAYDIPIEKGTNHIGLVIHEDNTMIVTVGVLHSTCKEYKIVAGEIIKVRNCGATDWKDFVKK